MGRTLSAREYAEREGCSLSTAYRRAKNGGANAAKHGGSVRFMPDDSVEKALGTVAEAMNDYKAAADRVANALEKVAELMERS